ncbi:MAG TPA: GAF and ANTAR domain-containing protein [Streptosporangiaceae bacterium]|nr:GAF and ANTAR domain-containing protein [Streptosporangiaceae bacterium]
MLNTHGIDEFLGAVARIAARQVGAGVSCGMTMRPNGRSFTVACSDSTAAEVDEIQYRLDAGPCLHAMRSGELVSIPDTAERTRWPEFEAEAAAAGIKSCLAVPLAAPAKESDESRPVGALNLYARTVRAFGPAQIDRAKSFAETASGALTLARRFARYADMNDQLRASLTSRSAIDQALGIIMGREQAGAVGARRHCTQARAFELLRAASQNTNTKLQDLARAIVTSVTGEPVQPPPFQDPRDAIA